MLESYDAMTTSPEQGDNPLPKWCQARASLESYGETFYELTKEGKLTGDSVPEVKELIAKTQWAIDMSLGDYDCSGV